ncbi:LLM class F420-dependent oxidoreductase [Kineosporia sp. J2-2]|uniref:LLM class F420-dependent oxidoreductase n=1 Tax=Kineosporia corallincola TaxID=2835133 RepID=A0ABS5TJL2_9ACTN|nr:LLM class F420-dependent oxidoreductase [Kineosporia corallincola]MBT0770579.1 LLM class F420-dependent oxidoreductase [Kineosporia corallincola]
MRIGMPLPYAGSFTETADLLPDYRKAGLSIVYVAEAYSFDAVSQLGFIAARVPDLEIAANILPIYTRTPALLAMTAAGLDHVSDGRFTLGLGASGPQVIEGFHGVPYDAPIGRTREIIGICRQVWRREKLEHAGRYYTMPLEGGTGLGKPLKLINHPVRERIPIMIAAMGPKNVELAAELAEGWAPFFFRPEGADQVWGEALAAGKARRDPALGQLDVVVPVAVAIGDDVEPLVDQARPLFALYLGGMGAKGKNFYFDLAVRYGYEAEATRIQELYLAGHRDEAAAAVPRELLKSLSLIGPRSWVAERVEALHRAGVTTLSITPHDRTHADRVRTIETLADLLPG